MALKPGYKHTEVGLIPDDWDVLRLSSLLEQPRSIRYGIVQPGKFEPRGCLMLRSQDYSKGWAGPDEMHRVNSQLESQYKNARIHSNDLIITVVGAGIGQVVSAPSWLDGAILSRSTARIAIDEKRASPGFVKASLESPIGKRQIMDSQKEGAQPVVSCRDLAEFLLPCPPLSEQRAITKALSDVDSLLDALGRLITKKRDLKQASMQQLLTGQTRITGFQGGWETKRLGEIADIKTGPFGSSLHESDYVREGTPIITVEHLGDFGVEHFNLPLVSNSDRQRLRAYSLEIGDIVFSRVGSVDRNALIRSTEAGWLFSGRLLRIRPDKQRVFAQFLSYQFHGERFKNSVRNVAVGQTMPCLNTQILKNLSVILPPLLEQAAIAAVLGDIDAELVALTHRREKTRSIKQAMMQELLTGKTRLV